MLYTVGWYDPGRGMSYEADYDTLLAAEKLFDRLCNQGFDAWIRCEVSN